MNRPPSPAIPPLPGEESADLPGPSVPASSIPGEEIPPHEPRNFFLLALYQIVLRTGWIFKTESVIMPAVMDQLTGEAWLRGCLPLLNRVGNSIPPALFAHAVHHQPRKKWAFALTTALMAVAFGGMTGLFVWPRLQQSTAAPYLYLLFYGLFFAALGVNNLVLNTLQGKLIRVTRRGRLLSLSNVIGAVTAIGAALLLLPLWLTPTSIDAASVFGFSTALFVVSALMAWGLAETPDHREPQDRPWNQAFRDAWQTLRDDAPFRRFAIVAGLFGCTMVLFPHYQAIGHDRLGLDRTHLVWWLIVQNIGTGLFSIPAGWLADRVGNKIVVQWSLVGVIITPLFALWLMHSPAWGPPGFVLVFGMVGLTPVAIKTLHNYTLEIAPAEHQPRYLGTLNLCLASPIFAAPLAGWLIGLNKDWGFDAAFWGVAGVIFVGWILSWGMIEPRQRALQGSE